MASSLILIVVLFAVTWFLLIRPHRKRQMVQRDMLQKLAVGDEVVTAGGMFGYVQAIGDDEVTVEVAPGTNVRIAKRAVAAVVSDDEEEDQRHPRGAEAPVTPARAAEPASPQLGTDARE